MLPVIGVNHFGGLRASIPAGEVTRLRAGNVLPFGGNQRGGGEGISGRTVEAA